MKKLIALLISGVIMLPCVNAFANDVIEVYIDGEKLECDVNPKNIDERVLVPMRAIFEALGAKVDWDGETRTVTATRGDDVMKITIDSNELFKNDESIALDVPAKIVDDSTLVPVRAVSESFDGSFSL